MRNRRPIATTTAMHRLQATWITTSDEVHSLEVKDMRCSQHRQTPNRSRRTRGSITRYMLHKQGKLR